MYRKLLLIPALILFSLLLMTSEARACEPCTKEASMKFEETARNADLIIVGQRYDFSPAELTNGTFGPEYIKLKVVRVLKGEVSQEEIKVKSWSGMCPYGIILNDNSQHVVFLKKQGDHYRAVAECGIKSYAVKDGVVELEKEKITIEDFQLRLKQLEQGANVSNAPAVFKTFYSVIAGG